MSLSLRELLPVQWSGEDKEQNDEDDVSQARRSGGLRFHVTAFGKRADTSTSMAVHFAYRPYFFLEVGLCIAHAQLRAFVTNLKTALNGCAPEIDDVCVTCVQSHDFASYAEKNGACSGFLKLSFPSLRSLRCAAGWLAKKHGGLRQYESRVDPVIRFFHDFDVVEPCHTTGSHPLRVDVSRACLSYAEETTCSEEYFVAPDALCPSVAETSRASTDDDETTRGSKRPTSSIIVASFDIECYSATGGFPDAKHKDNVIITICTVFSKVGGRCHRKVAVFLGNAAQPPPAKTPSSHPDIRDIHDIAIELICVSSEAELLREWARIMRDESVDIIAGYNIWGFDMPYLHQRALLNGGVLNPDLQTFMSGLSKVRSTTVTLVSKRVKSGGGRSLEAATLRTPGVLQVDLFYYLKRYHPRLDSYKLDSVARRFLGAQRRCPKNDKDTADDDDEDEGDVEKKNDPNGKTGLTIEEMHAVWRHGDASRKWQIVEYCVQDAMLVTRLVESLSVIQFVFEMANVCGVPPETAMNHGEQVKVYSLILRRTRAANMLCPTTPSASSGAPQPQASQVQNRRERHFRRQEDRKQSDGDDEDDEAGEEGPDAFSDDKLQGATVLEPVVDAYWKPIVCLDFQSLYPSIMMAHNLCHSTTAKATRTAARHLTESSEFRVVQGLRVSTCRRGILPDLLFDLQRKRNEAKTAMTAADARGDQYAASVFNAKQQAYKVSMNSVYGFCGVGTEAGIMPCMKVAAAVTAEGRSMIERTKTVIEKEFDSARVVYGDTDSVMIDFGRDSVEECELLGKRAAEIVTRLFRPPIKLCFDKCYHPFLLFSKKRYAGRVTGSDAIDCKGVQFVRNDTCAFVKGVCSRVMRHIMFTRNAKAAVDEARIAAARLLAGDFDKEYDEFVVHKTIKASAKDILKDVRLKCTRCESAAPCVVLTSEAARQTSLKEAPAASTRPRNVDEGVNGYLKCLCCGHVRRPAYKSTASPAIRVACSVEASCPGAGPRAGDAVPFVFAARTERHDEGHPQESRDGWQCFARRALGSDIAEHPDRARRLGLRLDARHYYEHQLKNVLVDIFAIVVPAMVATETGAKKRESAKITAGGGVFDEDAGGDSDSRTDSISKVQKRMTKRDVEHYVFGQSLLEYEAKRKKQRLITVYTDASGDVRESADSKGK